MNQCNLVVACSLLASWALSPAPAQSSQSAPSRPASAPMGDGALSPTFADGVLDPRLRGVWRVRGYGYLFSFTESQAAMYSTSKAGVWQHPPMDDLELLFHADPLGQRLRITPHPGVPGFMLERVEALPQIKASEDWTQLDVFDALASTMTEFYPFFEVRKVDWPTRVKAQRVKVKAETSDAELFAVFDDLLDGLNDGHVSLEAEFDGASHQARFSGEDTYTRLRSAFAAQSEVGDYPTFRMGWIDRFKKELEHEVLGGTVQFACNRKFVWGRIDNDVGYLFITGMGGFADGDIAVQIDALHTELAAILDALADTQGMIVDVSLNRGGMDLFSVEIASHFADQRRVGFSKFPANVPDYRSDRHVEPFVGVDGSPQTYTKPVFLVTNDVTASAAEIFTMCMRAFPHVSTVGRSTAGALSDVLDKTLPNGWEFGMSNEIYLDHEGVCHEGPGIPPKIELQIFDLEDINRVGHAKAIRTIAARARRK